MNEYTFYQYNHNNEIHEIFKISSIYTYMIRLGISIQLYDIHKKK